LLEKGENEKKNNEIEITRLKAKVEKEREIQRNLLRL